MPAVKLGERVFESYCDMVDATSMNRPDTAWRVRDPAGHEHAWYVKGATTPADAYSPRASYELPTLRWVVDRTAYFEDGEAYEFGHHECVLCGAHVSPGRTADTVTQYVPGLQHYAIDGREVSADEFQREYTRARLDR